MNKAGFLKTLQLDRAQWEATLSQIDEARMTQPGAVGAWTLKDLVAHVTWFEREMVDMLRARALAGSELWELPGDERNAAIHEENRERPLPEVLAEARRTYEQLLESLRSITDEELVDPGRFADMPGDWVPWQVIASNSFEHYRDHLPDLQTWLEKKP